MNMKIKGSWCLITPNRAKNQDHADSQYRRAKYKSQYNNSLGEKVAYGV